MPLPFWIASLKVRVTSLPTATPMALSDGMAETRVGLVVSEVSNDGIKIADGLLFVLTKTPLNTFSGSVDD